MAVVTRMRMGPTTRTYVENRTTEGRTLREIRRSLKRYLARQIYRQLPAAHAVAAMRLTLCGNLPENHPTRRRCA